MCSTARSWGAAQGIRLPWLWPKRRLIGVFLKQQLSSYSRVHPGAIRNDGRFYAKAAVEVVKFQADATGFDDSESRGFIGFLSNPPIPTATPENYFGEGLTNPIFLVYSQMARGLLSQQGITVG